MKELITMEQYVIELYHSPIEDAMEVLNMLYKRAKLLQSKPTLSMFVACDDECNVLEEPKGIKCCAGIINDCGCHGELIYDDEQVFKYQQALEKVIFEGWSVYENNNETIAIEDLEGNNLFFMKTNSSILFYSKNSTKPIYINTLSDLTKFKLKLK